MKNLNIVLVVGLLVASNALFAQKIEFDAQDSSIDWLGKKIGGQHEGNIDLKSGFIQLKEGAIVGGEFVIDMNSITCTDLEDEGYNKKLVGHLKSDDFFGVEKYPLATLVVTKASAFYDGKASLTGDLTIKGKTESVTFDVSVDEESYSAKIDIDRSKYDVRYGSNSFFDNLGDKAIDDVFSLDIELDIE